MKNIKQKYTTFKQSLELNELFRFSINHFDTVFIKRKEHFNERCFFGVVIEKVQYSLKEFKFGVKEYSNDNNIQLIKHETSTSNQKIIRAFDESEIDKILFTCQIKGIKYNHMTTYEKTVILTEGMTRNNLVMSSDVGLLDAKAKLLIELASKGFISF